MNFAASCYVTREDARRYMLERLRRKSTNTKRKNDFLPHFEPFRSLNEIEIKSLLRRDTKEYESPEIVRGVNYVDLKISYQALTGGFTICNIIVNGKLYSGSSHCSKVDRWLLIRGQMLAFKRALESTGIALPVNLPNGENEF